MKTKTLLAAVALFLTVGLASAQQKDTKSCCSTEKAKTCVCVDKDGNKICKKDGKRTCKSEKCKCVKECTKDAKATCTKDLTVTSTKDAKKAIRKNSN